MVSRNRIHFEIGSAHRRGSERRFYGCLMHCGVPSLMLIWCIVALSLVMAREVNAYDFTAIQGKWCGQILSDNAPLADFYTGQFDSYYNTNSSRTNIFTNLPFDRFSSNSYSANTTATFLNLMYMATSWAYSNSAHFKSPVYLQRITNSLDWMTSNVYTTNQPNTYLGTPSNDIGNWWDWEIGSPQYLDNILILLNTNLNPALIAQCVSAVRRFSFPYVTWNNGANLSDECLVAYICGIVSSDTNLMHTAQTNMLQAMRYADDQTSAGVIGDGMYRDGSFVHRNSPFNGHYGFIHLKNFSEIIPLLAGTPWDLSADTTNFPNVFDWAIQSYQPLIYNGAVLHMTMGKFVVDPFGDDAKSVGGVVSNAVQKLLPFAPSSSVNSFSNMFGLWTRNWNNSSKYIPPCQHHFGCMDQVVAWRSNYCFALSLFSSRINSRDGSGAYANFLRYGMTYLYTGPGETQFAANSNYCSTVDALHFPGTTVDQTSLPTGYNAYTSTESWVGGAQAANLYGVAGMALSDGTGNLKAKKSWFMFDGEIVCLGAAITAGTNRTIHTTVENRRVSLPPTNHLSIDNADFIPAIGWSSNLTGSSRWVSLGGVGSYYFPNGASTVQLNYEVRTATNGSTVASNGFVKIWFNHGISPTNSTYCYVLLPNATPADMVKTDAAYASNTYIAVVTNSPAVQCVKKAQTGLVAANFWTNGPCTADRITVDRQSSVIVLDSATNLCVGLSDPTQTNSGAITVSVALNRDILATNGCDTNITILQTATNLVLRANVKSLRGKTSSASFQYRQPILTVVSAHGTPLPGGATNIAYGTPIVATVTGPVYNGTTQYFATGWTGSGSVGSGTGTNVSFSLTNNTTLTWLWQTNLWLNLNTLGN